MENLTLKYRPHTWDDVVGQEFVVEILKQQIAQKKWKNAYLFCGSFGNGKTTIARIFANEINKGRGEPFEIDGASNNGVDNIRELIDRAQLAPVDCDYSCYLIDEAHMITTAGWNAALKLIEEPPAYSIFIFCTTDPDKLPKTILSRVQRFDFSKIPTDKIVGRLKYILSCEYENPVYDEQALKQIATLSDGHMRDAVKILGTCLDIDTNITVELVESTFGLVKQDCVNNIIAYMMNKDVQSCVKEIEHCDSKSFDCMKLYDAILSELLTNALNGSITQKKMCNIFYENRKLLNKMSAETLLKYCILGCCE